MGGEVDHRDQGLNRDLIGSQAGDYSSASEQSFGNRQKEKRAWGPGTDIYYRDTMSSLLHKVAAKAEKVEKKAEDELKGAMHAIIGDVVQFVKSTLNFVASKAAKSDGAIAAQPAAKSTPLKSAPKNSAPTGIPSEGVEFLRDIGDIALQAETLLKNEEMSSDSPSQSNRAKPGSEEWRPLVAPLSEKINSFAGEVEKDMAANNIDDPRMRRILKSMKELDEELQRDNPRWIKLQFLVQSIAIELQLDRNYNEKTAEQHSLDSQQEGVKRVADSYNSKVEMTIGILVGAASVVGGIATGGAGVFGIFGIGTKAFMDGLQSVGQGVSTVARGAGDPAQNFARSSKEAERQLQNYIIECSRSAKETAKSGGDNARGTKGGLMQQLTEAIRALHSAFSAIANASGS